MTPAHRWLPFCVFFLMAFGVALSCFVPIAFAQPAAAPVADGVVDLTPLVDAVFAAFAAALTAVVAWVGRAATIWFGLKSDSEVRAYVQAALERGVAYGLERARAWAKSQSGINVKNATVELALEYVVQAVPDGLKRLGLTDEKLKRLIEARLAPLADKLSPERS